MWGLHERLSLVIICFLTIYQRLIMKSLLSHLYAKFHQAAQKAFPDLTDIPTEVTVSTQAKFGHYQCNTAMKLTKALKQPPKKLQNK